MPDVIGKDALGRVLRVHDGSEFTADDFPTMGDAQAAREYVQRLRSALSAYRSALRSGEPESDQLRQLGDEALG